MYGRTLQTLHRMQANIKRPLYILLTLTEFGELQFGHL
jgi:hypothetical protein